MIKKTFTSFKSMSPAVKASIVLMLTQMIQKGLSTIVSPIYTRLLTTSEYGQTSLFFSWYEILVIFTGLCLSKGVFNNGMMDYKEDRDTYTLSMYLLTFISATTIGVVIVLFCKYIWNFINLPISLIAYMFLLLAFEAAMSLWTVRQRFEYKYKATAIVTLLISILSPICGVLGIMLFDTHKVYARIICARNIFLIGYFMILGYLIIKAKGKIKISYWKYALAFNLPIIPHYLSLHILTHMDRIMIASIVGTASAGIYSIAYSGASTVLLFWQSINASLIPWTYEKCKENKYSAIADLTKVLLTGFGTICIVFMFLAPEVMKILAPASYQRGIYVIPAVIAGVFYSSLYYIFANIVYYYKKPKYVMFGSCCSAIVNVFLNLLLIPVFGYLAAGYTTMVSYMLQTIIDYIAMKKILKRDIYDMHFIIVVSILVLFTAILLNFIYSYFSIRISLLLLFLGYFFFYMKKNKNVYMQLLHHKKKGQ